MNSGHMNGGINDFIKGFEHRMNLMKHKIGKALAYFRSVLIREEEAYEELGEAEEKYKIGREYRIR
jgi:hypothetical protein